MADTASAPVKSAKTKKPRVKPTHPPTNEMVHGAVNILKERNGSSLIAIKKHIAATYKVDAEKLAPFIKKALKAGVTKGTLVQTKGKGASGSFKLASKEKTVKKAAPKKTPTKKAATPKKAAAKKPSAGGDKKKSAKPAVKKHKTKTPSKAKKTKTPSKKPKAPKAKKSPAKKVARKSVVKK